jgi:hypothetical protein
MFSLTFYDVLGVIRKQRRHENRHAPFIPNRRRRFLVKPKKSNDLLFVKTIP